MSADTLAQQAARDVGSLLAVYDVEDPTGGAARDAIPLLNAIGADPARAKAAVATLCGMAWALAVAVEQTNPDMKAREALESFLATMEADQW